MVTPTPPTTFAVPGGFRAAPALSRPESLHTAREDNTPGPPRGRSSRASSTRANRDRHGSLEQHRDVFGRPMLARPTTPRPERSQEDDGQRERDRRDWRIEPVPQSPPGQTPPGFGSRLLVMENHLKAKVGEVQKLKGTVEQLGGMKGVVDQLSALFENLQKANIELDTRRDTTFAGFTERMNSSENASRTHLAEAAGRIMKLEEEL